MLYELYCEFLLMLCFWLGKGGTKLHSSVFSCLHEMLLEYNWEFMVHVERKESNEGEKE